MRRDHEVPGREERISRNLYELEGGPFDTIICLCNGLDKVGCLAGLTRFLAHTHRLLAPDGQLLADSFDLRVGASNARLAELARKEASGRYFGEMDMVFEYRGRRGAPLSVLQVDYPSLAGIAQRNGWRCEMIESTGSHYLTRLRPA